jgi:hypothetical protein
MSNKNALWAMLQGQVTPESANFAKKAAIVTAMSDEIGGKISVTESATRYGSLTPDPYGRTSDKRVVVESPSVDRFERFQDVSSAPAQYSTSQPQNIEASPDRIAALLSGDKNKLKQLKQQPSPYKPSPVVDAMNEAMGYGTPQKPAPVVYQPAPQILNEEQIRQSIQQIIKEELDNILLNNIFSENRMMKLYEQQLKNTLTKIIAEKMKGKKKNG